MLSNTSVARSASLREPYRATKLWLEAVAIFRRGVPLGKHRSYLKSYEDCFVAHDAIGWFHKQLQERFDSSIARKQALQLLQKFYKSGIFVPVSSRASYAEDVLDPVIKETDFKDNSSLYKLSGYTSDNNETLKKAKPRKSPAVANNSMPRQLSRHRLPSRSPSQLKYNVIINPLSLEQIYIIWKDVFTHRFVQIVGCEAFQALSNLNIQGERIRHNLTQTEKYGIVVISNPTDNVPTWLDKAMKTLATWPRSRTNCDQSLCHVNYPGLENDILKLIKDYFRSYSGGAPLLTFELYDACITTFIRAELFDFNARLYSSKTTSASRTRLCHQLNLPMTATSIPHGKPATPQPYNLACEEKYPFNASESVENLIMDILTPSVVREAARRGRGVSSRIQPKRILPDQMQMLNANSTAFSQNDVSMNPMEDSIIKSVPEPMSAKSFTAERYKNPFFYETAFTGCDSPVTRVVSETELKSTFCTLPRKPSTSAVPVGPMSTPPRFVYENPNLELSASDMIYHPKYSRILNSSLIPNGSHTPMNYSFYNYSNSDSFESAEASYHRTLPVRSHSSVELSDAIRDRTPYTPGGRNFYGRNPQGLMTPEGKRMAIVAFRLLTLLLPASQRKHLQLLLRFMSKVSRNDKLMLDVAVSTRALIINTFFRTILNSADSAEFDELLALRIVTFMVDNDAEIFNIGEESDLVKQVEEILSEEQVTKVPVKDPTPPPTVMRSSENQLQNSLSSQKSGKNKSKSKLKRLSYENKENESVQLQYYCNRVSKDTYEEQRLLGGTSQSLRDLLDGILKDPNLKDDFRKKKLAEFKQVYPHIYNEKLENGNEIELLNLSIKEEKRKDRNPFSTLLKPFRRNQ